MFLVYVHIKLWKTFNQVKLIYLFIFAVSLAIGTHAVPPDAARKHH